MHSERHAAPAIEQAIQAMEREEQERNTAARQTRQGGKRVRSLSWDRQSPGGRRITDESGKEFVALRFIEHDEDRNGHGVFRNIDVVIPVTAIREM